MTLPAPGDRVALTGDIGAVDNPQLATVVDHVAADMTPPDWHQPVVLVRWSRQTLAWEYVEDLVVVHSAGPVTT